jgi:hypothetical protein
MKAHLFGREQQQTNHSQRKTMSTIIQFVPAADPSFLTTNNKISAFQQEAEKRLWKLSSQTLPDIALIELFVFMVFLVVTVVGVISCFAELSSLLQSGAIDHLAIKALNWGA